MYEVDIINKNTGERDIIFTHYKNNPFADNPQYNKDEWDIIFVDYID